jgi:hypothetical protein
MRKERQGEQERDDLHSPKNRPHESSGRIQRARDCAHPRANDS